MPPKPGQSFRKRCPDLTQAVSHSLILPRLGGYLYVVLLMRNIICKYMDICVVLGDMRVVIQTMAPCA